MRSLSVCNQYFDEHKAETTAEALTIAIDPDAHAFGEWIAEVPADCTHTGTKAHKDCTLCGKHFDEGGAEIADLTIATNDKHDWGVVRYVWPSDSECKAERVCKHDGSHKETETVTATESVVTEATCEQKGKRFDSWNIKGVDDLTGLDLTKSPLTITMPANDINVAAVLEDIDYTVTVTGGTADKTTMPEERFELLAKNYETEQTELKEKVIRVKSSLTVAEENDSSIAKFISLVRSYTEVNELTPEILNSFIDKIYIGKPERINGQRVQEVKIVYKLVGAVNIPQ